MNENEDVNENVSENVDENEDEDENEGVDADHRTMPIGRQDHHLIREFNFNTGTFHPLYLINYTLLIYISGNETRYL